MANGDVKLQTLYDHYKETVGLTKESNKSRDRLIVCCLVLVAALFFQIISPTDSVDTIASILSQKVGISITANAPIISGIVWFALLVAVMRYFQAVIFSERQYDYIHLLEERLNSLCKGKLFTREGESYLGRFPLFSDWIHMVYTIIFPVILLFFVAGKMVEELCGAKNISAGLIFDTAISAFVLITTCLYLLYIHWKK